MKHTLKYISSIFFLLLVANAFSQEIVQDSIVTKVVPAKVQRYGIRVGADISKIARSFYEDDYKGLELVGDYRLTKKIYLAAELGTESKKVLEDRLTFVTEGTYIKVGADFNAYENWLGMSNLIYIGGRYGASTFSQQLDSYTIYNANPYFGEEVEIISGEKFDGLSASWIEVVAGVKVEVVKNLYAGFSLRLNYLINDKQPENFSNLYIPGFNRTYDGNFGVGFNYSISYFIPLYKK